MAESPEDIGGTSKERMNPRAWNLMNEIFMLINSRNVDIDIALDAVCCAMVNVAMNGKIAVEEVQKNYADCYAHFERLQRLGYMVGVQRDDSNPEHMLAERAVRRELAGFQPPDSVILNGLKRILKDEI